MLKKEDYNINSVVEELKQQYSAEQILKARHVSILLILILHISKARHILLKARHVVEFLHSIMVIFCIDSLARLP